MPGSLIIYSSTDGQTKTICEKIKSFSKNSESIKLISLEEASDFNLQSYEDIIIGASIRYGKHSKNLYKFISSNKETLEKKKSAFFSVNVVARKPEKNTPETNPYMKKFLKISNWKPDRLGVFAGKVNYPNYSFFDKYIIRLIMFITKGPTDTSKSFEFTDWSKVEDFAKELSLSS
ncbi:menaquinone-dependent protoporphyrinogen IX dehydrogenase [Candidatus Pelagibacter giovannonii]|uniref:Protoporphyrinogen IX dehydrogenase [quinone] n=1 Tax=Candidatus Pelagibacter giovannonii TaxID=2563896 RepID=A0A6H1Q3W9_9PROT|nr:menaquinone-dependent protoporphyrinogen IX dehydrogenase [Candidatus Pelagibacter giovannonii]QIZ21053.1 menaquinone-dependent protoporphyrinogen IX dehydrogenase [Candidatus Pelagibacter giovannonii]